MKEWAGTVAGASAPRNSARPSRPHGGTERSAHDDEASDLVPDARIDRKEVDAGRDVLAVPRDQVPARFSRPGFAGSAPRIVVEGLNEIAGERVDAHDAPPDRQADEIDVPREHVTRNRWPLPGRVR